MHFARVDAHGNKGALRAIHIHAVRRAAELTASTVSPISVAGISMRFPLHRSAAVGLALAAMLLRALLPDGWMPVAGPSPFTICSVDAGHHDGKSPADQEHSHAPSALPAAA